MAVTYASKSVTLGALNDEATGVYELNSLMLSGTGLTVGGQVVVKDSYGSIISSRYIGATSESAEMIVPENFRCRGIKITTAPTGTWLVVARHK